MATATGPLAEFGRRGSDDPMGPVRVPKTSELVASQLRRKIINGDLAAGATLPPEAALMQEFAVSRPTLREAFRVLESESLITIRRGARGGAQVQVPTGDVAARYAGLVLQYRGATLRDLYDARTVIEAPCAARVAQIRTDDDLARLQRAVEEAEALVDDPSSFIRSHLEFHHLLVELAGSPTLTMLNGMVRHLIDQANLSYVDRDAGTPENLRANHRGLRAHVELVSLIAQGRADAAERLWRVHLEEARDYLLSDTSKTTVLDLFG